MRDRRGIGIHRENDLLLVVFLGYFFLPFSGWEFGVLRFVLVFSSAGKVVAMGYWRWGWLKIYLLQCR